MKAVHVWQDKTYGSVAQRSPVSFTARLANSSSLKRHTIYMPGGPPILHDLHSANHCTLPRCTPFRTILRRVSHHKTPGCTNKRALPGRIHHRNNRNHSTPLARVNNCVSMPLWRVNHRVPDCRTQHRSLSYRTNCSLSTRTYHRAAQTSHHHMYVWRPCQSPTCAGKSSPTRW
jgi:hypothetical protein